ncbi:MAG: hypothetical protein J3K34DRAFT_524023, partial [Monoraphidium minutum]
MALSEQYQTQLDAAALAGPLSAARFAPAALAALLPAAAAPPRAAGCIARNLVAQAGAALPDVVVAAGDAFAAWPLGAVAAALAAARPVDALEAALAWVEGGGGGGGGGDGGAVVSGATRDGG